ncbi:MAG: pyruvate dehydrogenase complex dihydrolipoamide acetyltransferase [Bacteroidetes bacterium QS_9_68_14]|nr:MAG: pyruvate dehydrogenase complex dihydrolipoamide acetyltransferase [Bacteroidetes bacterium QS_9_68_14]
MAIAVEMPKLSDTMEEGVVSTWLAEEGDAVEAGDVIAQVETDKATMDLEVFDDGVLLKKVVEEGATVPLGELLVVLGEEGEDPADVLAKYGGDGAAAEAPTDEADEEELSGAEETPEDEAPHEDEDAGTKHDGASHENGSAPADESEDEATPQQPQQPAPSGENGRLRASPLARNMASENDIDLAGVEGSGPQGRIIKRDIEALLSGEKEAAPAGPEATPAGDGAHERPAEAVPQPEEDLYEAEPISQMRETIARRLAASKFTAPHFYLTVDVDAAPLMDAREQLNALAEEREQQRLSVNDLITKDHPQVNASYLEDEGEVRRYKQVHVGVAVAVEEGLLTPVVRHADGKGLAAIAEETRTLAGKARDQGLQPEEYEGATFTTSNLGMFGIEEFTAIINPPNACILAIGAVREEPVVENGEVVPGQRMKLTLSCDHRVVDGATGAKFLQTLQGLLEEPTGMLL